MMNIIYFLLSVAIVFPVTAIFIVRKKKKSRKNHLMIFLSFVPLSTIVLIFVWLFYHPGITGDIAIGVKKNAIRKIEIGMSEDEVKEILGSPLQRNDPYTCGKICTTNEDCKGACASKIQLIYAEGGPRLWVYLHRNQVEEVYAKYFPSKFDDAGVYLLTEEQHWEADEFGSAFPR